MVHGDWRRCEACPGRDTCADCAGADGADGKVGVTLRFSREEIIADVKHAAWVQYDIVGEGKETNLHRRHLVAEIAESPHIDRAARLLEDAFYSLLEVLAGYVDESVADGDESDNLLRFPEQLTARLRVPADMPRSALHALRSAMHQFMVNRLLADWLAITDPAASEKWALAAAGNLEQVKSLRNRRKGTLRIRTHFL